MPTATTDERKRIFGFDLEKTFRITAEISSVALLAGFVVSAAINQVVFASWGLDFISYATPSDVVMSGIGFLLDTALPLVFALFTMIGPFWLLQKSQEAGARDNDWTRNLVIFAGYTAIAIWLAQFLSGIVERTQSDGLAFDATRFGDAYLLTVIGVAVGVSLPVILHIRSSGKIWRNKIRATLVLLLAVVFGVPSLINIVKLRVELGYQRSLMELSAPAGDGCASGLPMVLWIGSEWTVVQCIEDKPFSIRSDTAGTILQSEAVGMCDPDGIFALWECSVRRMEDLTSEPEA